MRGPWDRLIYSSSYDKVDISSQELHEHAQEGKDFTQNFRLLNRKAHTTIRQKFGSIEDFLTKRGAWRIGNPERVPDARELTQSQTSVCRVIRNTQLVSQLKHLYEYNCQVCGDQRKRHRVQPYAEGHHIRPLSHSGPDIKENMLVLCPNHHADLDYGMVSINPDSWTIAHAYENDTDGGVLSVRENHDLNSDFLAYHNEHIVII